MSQARLLITDDDDTTLEMLTAALQDDYGVEQASGGAQALALAGQSAFDLILLDVDMPDMDGHEVCRQLKSQPELAEVPVIFLSAKVNLEERLLGYQAGACDYLTKPFDVAELKTKIELAVAARARDKALNAQIEDAMNAVLSTANMYGEIGVVLELQRALAHCADETDMANAFFAALEKSGFDGCLRLRTRQGQLSRTARTTCSALERSLLDHIEAAEGPSIQPIGRHTFFRYGPVVMLIRDLPVSPSPDQHSYEDIERFARARDNIALMAEGLLARIQSLDIETQKSTFEQTRKLVDATREALMDITAQQHANRLQMSEIFQRMNSEIETSFIHLGLSETQEEQLTETLRRHIGQAMGLFDQSDQIETHLNRLVRRLEA
ncbi:MAG: response regulator [Aquabacterium sp.]